MAASLNEPKVADVVARAQALFEDLSFSAAREWKALAGRLNLAMFDVESGQGSLGKILFTDDLYLRMTGMLDDLQAHPWKLLARPKK